VSATLSSDSDWLLQFRKEHGRPLRVLHIGNIANNAYINAKIQRRRGIEADVACYDYFHVMGCPEWEDAEFEGEVDDFHPDWWSVDLHGFRRPRWFAQGDQRLCIAYLLATRRRQGLRSALYWRLLTLERWLRSRHPRLLGVALGIARALRRRLRSAARLLRVLARAGQEPRRALRVAAAVARGAELRVAMATYPSRRPAATTPVLDRGAPELGDRFRGSFPARDALLSADVCLPYAAGVLRWKPLLSQYDIVQAYATDPVIPLLCGVRAYAAYEHGTLRVLPFEPSAYGQLCALAYRGATSVFVTNSDNLAAAERLGIVAPQLVCLPHACDSEKLRRFAERHRNLGPDGRPDGRGTVTFFCPTRQHWLVEDPNLAKGNDRFVRALRMVRDQGLECRVVLVDWGEDVEATKRLLEQLGCEDWVTWIPKLPKRGLWERYLRSHAVVDQFVVPAMGSVAFESLALGRRVVSALDPVLAARFFGEAPPLLACTQPEEIAAALRLVIEDPEDTRGVGRAAAEWFDRFHSTERIVHLQLAAYRRAIDNARRLADVP
jgi:glycosyltransferase involved in cell wall biosynthesis